MGVSTASVLSSHGTKSRHVPPRGVASQPDKHSPPSLRHPHQSIHHVFPTPQTPPTTITITITTTPAMNHRRPKKSAAARRGLRSLSVAVAFPLSLTLLDIFLFGSTTRYRTLHKPFYFPPLWALHLACLTTAFLSGLSSWLVWAEGGFHKQPTALGLYLAQLALSLVWYPVVFGAGAIRIGLVLCGALFGVLLGCTKMFRNMNPIAGDLVKPCLAWALLLAVANFRLVLYQ